VNYQAKPKIGKRASAPGQIWHIDQTILRLEDGTRAFVQAIIDNFSRYVLAWNVSDSYGGGQTAELLMQAVAKAKELGLSVIPNVFVDSGVENINSDVDHLVATKLISRTIAQIETEFSNSMIEMLFLRLKHIFLFLRSTHQTEPGQRRWYHVLTSPGYIRLIAQKLTSRPHACQTNSFLAGSSIVTIKNYPQYPGCLMFAG